MIANAKRNLVDNNFEKLCDILFLTRDGEEVSEDPVLTDNKFYVSPEDHNKFGKVEIYETANGIKQKYFLKQYRGGRPGELLVDPYGMFAKPEDLTAFITQRGHQFCEYILVNPDVYHSYVNYLQSRDVRYFRFCEKSILDTVR